MTEFRDKLLSQSVVVGPSRKVVLVDTKEKLKIRDENGHDTTHHESGRVDVNINIEAPVKGSFRTGF
jgi:hypothetical protein